MIDSKKKVLLLVPRMPYPLNSGGRIAIYETVKSLSKLYDLSLIIIDDNSENKKYVPSLEEFSSDITFFSKNKLRFALNSLTGLLKGMPLQAGYFYFKDVQKIVDEKAAASDLIVAFMIRTTTYGLGLSQKKYHYAIDS